MKGKRKRLPRISRKSAREVAASIFSTPNISEIFVRGFRTIASESHLFHLHDHTPQHRARLYETPAYKRSHRLLIEPIVSAVRLMERSSDQLNMVTLPPATESHIKVTLEQCLFTALERDFCLVLLAFLKGIDAYFSILIERAQFLSSTSTKGLTIIDGIGAIMRPTPLPSPLSDFEDKMPPQYVLPSEYLALEDHFQNLTAPVEDQYPRPHPAILRENLRSTSAFRRWKVGFINILGTIDSVHLRYDATRFWVPSLKQEASALVHKRLKTALRVIEEEQVDLYLLPELNVDREISAAIVEHWNNRTRISGRSTPIGIAGEMHSIQDSTNGTYWNRPVVFTQRGSTFWRYWKQSRASIQHPKDHDKKLTEALGNPSDHVVAMDTPAGRVCIVICKDFLMDHIRRSVMATRSNLVVVPAMTNARSVAEFQHYAREMAAACRAVTVFCNSSIALDTKGNDGRGPLGFIHPHIAIDADKVPRHILPKDAVGVVTTYTFEAGMAGSAKVSQIQISNSGERIG
jgi:hypothetical protein